MDEEIRQHEMDSGERVEPFDEEQLDEEIREEEIQQREGRLSEQERQPYVEETVTDNRRREEIREDSRPEQRREPSAMDKELVPLLRESEAEDFRSRWLDIQTEFVDDPRNSVERADELVARVINSITENFASERTSLENQWNQGAEVSTEDLRLAMKRYRSFFNRLLTLEASGIAE